MKRMQLYCALGSGLLLWTSFVILVARRGSKQESPKKRRRAKTKPAMAGKREPKGLDDEEGEERHYNPFLPNNSDKNLASPKLQCRSIESVGRWDEEIRMAEIVEKKGKIWGTAGIIRGSKLYYHIEEIAFLVERGALEVTCDEKPLVLRDIYGKLAAGSAGCLWKSFEAYRYLKLLGFIVQRHGVQWSEKNEGNYNSSKPLLGSNEESSRRGEETLSTLLNHMQINEMKPMFDVYLPNSKFRKSSPGEPDYFLCILSENPPSRVEFEKLEKQYAVVILRYCYVDHGRVSFFTFDKVLLPTLP